MKKKSVFENPLISFVTLTYIIFFMLFMVIGICIWLGAPEWLTVTMQIMAAWSSTFAFIILFKRIYPELRLKDFIKQQFTTRLRFSVLGTIVAIQVIIVVVTMLLHQLTNTQGFAFSYPGLGLMALAFLDNVIRGPLGEELSWRGYALNELQKKYSPLKSALIIGVLWGFWHTPLWLASGYNGVDLVKYSVLFLIGIISFSIIVTFFYNMNPNLVIPIVIHQLFNFSLVVISGDLLEIMVYVMLLYFVVAVLLVVINPKGNLYKKKH
ncbi:CPBP family intramembrane glutamic endopeptidase [Ornithinibacillus sp. 179-J 7C1 HS]|uniref:CPBP family intramembrane glutamic endopeptidase n=1 Tax=Ornithinibacillus sp. 179-J 7C1 HS TaxID=3142384 RepID=UPI0039A21CDE